MVKLSGTKRVKLMPLSVENEVSSSQAMGTSQIKASSASTRWRMTEKMPFFHFALLELLFAQRQRVQQWYSRERRLLLIDKVEAYNRKHGAQ